MEMYENNMLRQVLSLPELLREQYEDLEPKTRTILSTPEIFSVQKIILTGCGDSHAAAMAAKYAFEKLTGIPTEVVPAIELSYFYSEKQLGFAPYNPLVIAVSNSGNAARVAEAAQRVTAKGGFMLAITSNAESILAKSSSRILKLAIPPFEAGPGVRSYMVSLLSLLLLAIRFGEVRQKYTMDQAADYRKDILRQASELEAILPALVESTRALALRWKGMEAFDFVGAGPDFAAAFYGHAKIFEAVGKCAMCVNTEEWLHLNFFQRNVDRIGTVVVCDGRSLAKTRTGEVLLHAVVDMGRPTLLITDINSELTVENADIMRLPTTQFEITAPLLQFIPLALLSGYIARMVKETDGRGCEGPWAFARQGAGVAKSTIIVK